MGKKGKLYLIPAPLGDDGVVSIPAYVVEHLHRIDIFIAERAKTARRFIKRTQPTKPFDALTFYEINKRTLPEERSSFLDAALKGQDIGLLSEAGCPGVADPGAIVVEMAHQKGLSVVPLVGPSSILLILMASGMNGQRFCFHGYLPAKKPDLVKALQRLESESRKNDQTQIFIETPYRNNQMVEAVLMSLDKKTRFAMGVDLTLPSEFIISKPVGMWQKNKLPEIHKRPAIFCLQAGKPLT